MSIILVTCYRLHVDQKFGEKAALLAVGGGAHQHGRDAGPREDRWRAEPPPLLGLCLVVGSFGVSVPSRADSRAHCDSRAGELASHGAWALGERNEALGQRRVCAVCGARRAMWCVRGVLRTMRCVGCANWMRVRGGSGRRGRPRRCRSADRDAVRRKWHGRRGRRRGRRRLDLCMHPSPFASLWPRRNDAKNCSIPMNKP